MNFTNKENTVKHLTKSEHNTAMVAIKERDHFAQSNAILLAACKVLVAAIPNPLHPARMQGQAAIDLAEMGHVPRRPAAEVGVS